ncbi:MAG: hypothetical protein COB41_00415 [Proteobacteria bacterium]|nr:MAG: hypothetical protein COB41_00415 [Pseudomonadota bacterium]
MGKMKFGAWDTSKSSGLPINAGEVFPENKTVEIVVEKEVPVYINTVIEKEVNVCVCKDFSKDIKQLNDYTDKKCQELEDSISYCGDSYNIALERIRHLTENTNSDMVNITEKYDNLLLSIDVDNNIRNKTIKLMKISLGVVFAISLVSLMI